MLSAGAWCNAAPRCLSAARLLCRPPTLTCARPLASSFTNLSSFRPSPHCDAQLVKLHYHPLAPRFFHSSVAAFATSRDMASTTQTDTIVIYVTVPDKDTGVSVHGGKYKHRYA